MLVMIFSLIFCVFAQDISWDVQEEVLGHGLRLYTHTVPNTKMISVMFRYHISDDVPEGVAHFVEHLSFLYRDKRRTYDQVLEQIGGDSQGRTDLATIKLNIRIPVENWSDWVLLEKNRQAFPCESIEDDIFEVQRMVIVQEYMQGMGIIERAYAQELRTAAFGNQGAGRSVIGSIDDISDWSKGFICEYMNRIILHEPVDVFLVGDIGEIDVQNDIRIIFPTSRRPIENLVEEQRSTSVQLQHMGKDALYVLWPIPVQSHLDTLVLRYWMMMMTHSRFGVLQKNGIQAKGWMEYGSRGGYLLLQIQGKKISELERDIRTYIYGFGGWVTAWRHASLFSKIYHRSIIHSWKTLEGRLSWLEYCVQADVVSTCFETEHKATPRDLGRVKKQWLRWEQAAILRVESP